MESGGLFNFRGRLRHDGQSLEHIGLLALLIVGAGVNVEVSAGHGVERDLIRGRDGEEKVTSANRVNILLRERTLLQKEINGFIGKLANAFRQDYRLPVERTQLSTVERYMG